MQNPVKIENERIRTKVGSQSMKHFPDLHTENTFVCISCTVDVQICKSNLFDNREMQKKRRDYVIVLLHGTININLR